MPFYFAAAAAVAGVVIGNKSRKDAKSQSKKALNQQSDQFDRQLAASDPFGKYRDKYATQLNDLMDNPASVKDLPGYQFQVDQGADAILRRGAAGGQLGSGNLGAALTEYGQGFAEDYFSKRLQQLSILSGAQAVPGAPGVPSAGPGIQAGQNNFSNTGDLLASAGYALNAYSQGGGFSRGSFGGTGAGSGATPGYGGGTGYSAFSNPEGSLYA